MFCRPVIFVKLYYWDGSDDQGTPTLSSGTACWSALAHRIHFIHVCLLPASIFFFLESHHLWPLYIVDKNYNNSTNSVPQLRFFISFTTVACTWRWSLTTTPCYIKNVWVSQLQQKLHGAVLNLNTEPRFTYLSCMLICFVLF